MFKLIGAVLLLGSSVWLGVLSVQNLVLRVKTLRSITSALDAMERELNFRLPPMKQWLSTTAGMSSEPAASFLLACSETIGEQGGRSMDEIWRHCAKEKLPMLKPNDLEDIYEIGSVLGRYDSESQRNIISSVRLRLMNRLEAAKEERRNSGKVYGVLSAAAGFFILIILV